MSFLDTRELLAMMHTCRTLHSEGLPHLLARQHKLHDPRKTRAFCKFVLADTPRRCNLLTVYLEEKRLKRHPELGTALSALGSLKALKIENGTKAYLQLLMHLDSPLKELDIVFHPIPAHALAHVLDRFASSLETLRIFGLPLRALALPPFPRLRKVEMALQDASYDIRILIHAFPHITDFVLSGTRLLSGMSTRVLSDERSIGESTRNPVGRLLRVSPATSIASTSRQSTAKYGIFLYTHFPWMRCRSSKL
ncbi:hypothetical protein OBBRIDRAFT_348265 [Obba rivulosa]|uniref:F-box domain-containing protein n=1 Tax=Obba rivulosa TaxID=1052685 RepID=A0A8E2DGM9_9APHY|nr:hypothetical protein OBBRIDRAFT_348265 [Obba rivulosa]